MASIKPAVLALVICQMLVMACGPTLTPTPTHTPVPTAVPTATPTRTPTPTPALTPASDGLVPLPTLPPPVPLVAGVTRVIDGDTVEVVFLFGSTDWVSLLGVETPETFGANRPDEFGAITDIDCLDEWGSLATDFAVRVLQGQTVTLIKDPAAGERGLYGPMLAYIHVDDQDFNATLVEQGYARVYTEGESSREGDYLRLEERAREQQIGLWGCE